ncbi:hypothetical protein B0H13DRAFT_2260974 [Mycena leptocephala]|nr:hypothetical protein B0H13DRAFT_2260974 [Mycena leptocephala]
MHLRACGIETSRPPPPPYLKAEPESCVAPASNDPRNNLKEGRRGKDYVTTPGEFHLNDADGAGHEAGGIGGQGGTGHSLKLGERMVYFREGAQVPGLDVTMAEFCRRHCFGQEIADLLRQKKRFRSPGDLQHVEDLVFLEDGFKVGHIAELKWALRRTVGKDLLVRSGKPELHGGIGGKGGDGGKEGGGGGDGESPGVPNTLLSWFVNIWGGIGGQGGRGGAGGTNGTNGTNVKNGTGQGLQYPQSPVTLWERFRSIRDHSKLLMHL